VAKRTFLNEPADGPRMVLGVPEQQEQHQTRHVQRSRTKLKTTVTESISMGRSRPKEKHQHDSPNDAPYSPSDVGVFRLPFQDSFVKGHDKYPSLLSSHDREPRGAGARSPRPLSP
jgi:hypothetical protein